MSIEAATSGTKPPSLKRRLASQGVLLFSGFAVAQALSFGRNALIAHVLAKGDFGIAATITLLLQMVETLTDIGSDRLIVQAHDGNRPRFVAAAHTVLIARGVLLGVLLFALGAPLAQFFGVPQAAFAFQVAALTPLLKGFLHLDVRRAQRHLNNTPLVLLEVVPQALALAAAWPLLAYTPSYAAVVWLALLQAASMVALSHMLAERRYVFAFDAALLKRQLTFGWPIIASALPLAAVYQGDRLVIGRVLGMEQLAGFSVAFMITMVPGLIAAKVGHALMLPVFADALRHGGSMRRAFRGLTEATVLFAALYFAGFAITEHAVVPALFGAHYSGLESVTTALAAMWALRMLQAVPGMALMAAGQTKPFFVAGVVRAHALPCILVAAWSGAGLTAIALIGVAFEAASLAYIALRLERLERHLGLDLMLRAGFLLPAGGLALAAGATPSSAGADLVTLAVVSAVIVALATAVMPQLRAEVQRLIAKRTAAAHVA